MTSETAKAYAPGYEMTIKRDGTRWYECRLCSHSAPGLDIARAHHALHVAGPDMRAALQLAEDILERASDALESLGDEQTRGLVRSAALEVNFALAKLEP